MAGPLHGVRIVELPAIGPVPFLGMLLADLGAEVVRVEKLPSDPLSVSALGRGRRSIALDLRRPGAAEVVLRMAERSDAAMTEGAAYLGTMTRGLFASGAWHDSRAANILDGGAPNYRCYACSDGRYVAVGALEPKFWQVLVDKLGLDAPSPYDRHNWP